MIGVNGTGDFTFSGGTWNAGGSGIVLGQNPGSDGTLALIPDIFDGGTQLPTLTLDGSQGIGGITVGGLGHGKLDVDGGGIQSTGLTQISVGNGDMIIGNGSTVTVGSVLLGFPSPNATLLIDSGGVLDLGANPGGGMTIFGGSVTVKDAGSMIRGGNLSFASGQVTVMGGAQWNMSDPAGPADLMIGIALPSIGLPNAGPAVMTIETGSSGSNTGNTIIGLNAGSDGTLIITGAGSTWNTGGSVTVGAQGHGLLDIADGGVLTSGADGAGVSGYVGQQNGGVGVVTVTGDGSKWDADGIVQIGAAGNGSLTISSKAEVDASAMSIGTLAGGVGTVGMTGGILAIDGALTVGDAGTGTLTVAAAGPDDKGVVTSASGIIGAQAGSNGSVTIGSTPGNGTPPIPSQWTIQQGLVVGQAGTGSLDIMGTVTDLTATIGKETSGNGQVTVDNGGSWTTTNDLIVGDRGTGSLAIGAGGVVNVTVGASTVGKEQGSHGSVDVKGQWNMLQNLVVGAGGTGTMKIEMGGAVASGDGHIGQLAGSSGAVTVTDQSSIWTVNGQLNVGEGGTGTLSILNGGQVSTLATKIGAQDGANGTVTVSGSGSSLRTTGAITVGGDGGTGLLKVGNGATVTASQVNLGVGGTLAGQGVHANVSNNGGTVTPTDGPGLMTITGNYTQTHGKLVLDIDGSSPDQFDRLLVTGVADFEGGTIDIVFGDGFVPLAGEEFDLIDAIGGLTVTPDVTVDILDLPDGMTFAETFGPNGLDLSFGPGGGDGGGGVSPPPPPSSVPEAGTASLFGTGFALVVLLRRGRAYRVMNKVVPSEEWTTVAA